MKFCILFIVISKYILINFQTNPMICWNFFTFVHELLDNPSYKSVNFVKEILLAILFYEQFMYYTQINLSPNTQLLSTKQIFELLPGLIPFASMRYAG